MGLPGDGTKRHAARAEALHDVLSGLHLVKVNLGPCRLQSQSVPQHSYGSIVLVVLICLVCFLQVSMMASGTCQVHCKPCLSWDMSNRLSCRAHCVKPCNHRCASTLLQVQRCDNSQRSEMLPARVEAIANDVSAILQNVTS